MVAAMLWQIFKPEQSRNVVVHLERHTDLLEFTCCTGWSPRGSVVSRQFYSTLTQATTALRSLSCTGNCTEVRSICES